MKPGTRLRRAAPEDEDARRGSSPRWIRAAAARPTRLRAYGIAEDAWSNDEEMFALVHQMRTRIITSPRFTGERIIGAILFENTMDRDIEGQPTRGLPVERETGRAVPEGGQGPGRGEETASS